MDNLRKNNKRRNKRTTLSDNNLVEQIKQCQAKLSDTEKQIKTLESFSMYDVPELLEFVKAILYGRPMSIVEILDFRIFTEYLLQIDSSKLVTEIKLVKDKYNALSNARSDASEIRDRIKKLKSELGIE